MHHSICTRAVDFYILIYGHMYFMLICESCVQKQNTDDSTKQKEETYLKI